MVAVRITPEQWRQILLVDPLYLSTSESHFQIFPVYQPIPAGEDVLQGCHRDDPSTIISGTPRSEDSPLTFSSCIRKVFADRIGALAP